MSFSRFHVTAITAWFALVFVIIAGTRAAGIPMTLTGMLSLLGLACLPPAVLMVVFRGAPPPGIAQVLYDQEQAVSREVAARLDWIHRPR